MQLHENKELFTQLVKITSQALGIEEIFVEKDYWITRSLRLMSERMDPKRVIFKGGTSLTKAYRIGNRFSEDIDIAIADIASMSGNQLKMLLKRTCKAMTEGLTEMDVNGVTSKGSRFHKTVHAYPLLADAVSNTEVSAGRILLEISSFANPYPYASQSITSFIHDYLVSVDRVDLIETYGLKPFEVNVLDKRQTMLEKLVSLYRFSLTEEYFDEVQNKIRHFYDLHFLLQDRDVADYVARGELRVAFDSLWEHDQAQFDVPEGWREKTIEASPLVRDFETIWKRLKPVYNTRLAGVAYASIPDEKLIAESFLKIQKALLG